MTRNKLYMLIQTVLCILLAILLASAAIRIYREGANLQQAGEALAWIYTKEKVAQAFAPIIPVFFGAIGLMTAGLILGIRDERPVRPVRDDKTQPGFTGKTTGDLAIKKSARKITIIRIVLIAAAAVMIVAGILNGSMRDVLIKAINICTECIGLG